MLPPSVSLPAQSLLLISDLLQGHKILLKHSHGHNGVLQRIKKLKNTIMTERLTKLKDLSRLVPKIYCMI